MENKTKKLLVLLGVLAVIVLIIVVAASQGRKKPIVVTPTDGTGATPAPTASTTPEETAAAIPVNEILKGAKVEAPGANPITKDNKVVTLSGEQTKTDVAQSSALAPAITRPIEKEQLAPSAISLDISAAAGFSPKEFTVRPGAPVTLAITSVDNSFHGLIFEDAALSAIGLTARPGQTRAVTFNAPKAGEYVFYCNVGGVLHKNRGEVGKMIVK